MSNEKSQTENPAAQADTDTNTASRREFLGLAAGVASAPLWAAGLAGISPTVQANAGASPAPAVNASGKHNILFVFADQERYITQWPRGFHLPGHERLRKTGTTFRNHYCPAVMCTSSRAVMMTGLQTADNRMFENADMPYVKAMSTDVPTIGHMLRKAGYYTAYKGKWHLDASFDAADPDRVFSKNMEAYGFSDFGLPVDGQAHDHGGHHVDQQIASGATSWLRSKGRQLNAEDKPWALFVSLVNPHDIMYFNTDLPGEAVQDTGRLMMRAARAPEHADYQASWKYPLPASLNEPMDAPGRPAAHGEFLRSWGYTLGNIPAEPARWQRFSDYYFNCLRAVDRQLETLLNELDALGLDRNTIVVFTSDHGEMAGAHGLRGKGPFAYEQCTHIPLHVVHPDVKGGKSTDALTSHMDLVPSLLAMAGVDAAKAADFAGRTLPGRDFSPVLAAPEKSGLNAVRDSILYTYSGIATNDSEAIRIVSEARATGKNPKEAMQAAGYRPNLKKRGSLRSVFDGRYKFTRYFSPMERNAPQTLEELYRYNDVELFDLKTDPAELNNLAAKQGDNADLVLQMSAKLEAIIKAEIGVDDGREMPAFDKISWAIDRIDL